LGKDISQAFNFDPEGDTLPVLYDQYDRLAESYWSGVKDDFSRLFEFVHPGRAVPERMFLPRFSQVAFIAQMLHLDFYEEIEKLKGSALTGAENIEARERRDYALRWLEAYAPEKFVFKLQEETPQEALNLSDLQKRAMKELLSAVEEQVAMPTGEELHHRLHAIKESLQIQPGELFGAIYLGFLGKAYGPKAGWFLSVLDREFVLKRLRAITG
jgi:lysyl-tRNA synthetase class 1